MQEQALKSLNYCRTCNKSCIIAFPLFAKNNIFFGDKTLKRYIEETLHLEVAIGDNLPEFVCLQCFTLLQNFYELQCKSLEIDKKQRRKTQNNATSTSKCEPAAIEIPENTNIVQISVGELIINDADNQEAKYSEAECGGQDAIIQRDKDTRCVESPLFQKENNTETLTAKNSVMQQKSIPLRTQNHNDALQDFRPNNSKNAVEEVCMLQPIGSPSNGSQSGVSYSPQTNFKKQLKNRRRAKSKSKKSVQKRRITCNICGKNYANKSNVKRHINSKSSCLKFKPSESVYDSGEI